MVRALTWVFGAVSLRARQMKAWLARRRLGVEIFPGLQSSFDHANSLFRPRITHQGCDRCGDATGSLSIGATERPTSQSLLLIKLAPPFWGTRDGKGVHHGTPDLSINSTVMPVSKLERVIE